MLRNINLEKATYLGANTFRATLKDNGREIRTFTAVSIKLIHNPHNTRKTFAQAVAKFIDFCIEAQLQSDAPLTRQILTDGYLMFLNHGSEEIAKLGFHSEPSLMPFLWLKQLASVIPQAALKPKSFDVVVPAINLVINAAERVVDEDLLRIRHDPTHEVDDVALLLAGRAYLESPHYRDRNFYISTQSSLSDSIRGTQTKIKRPRGLGAKNFRKQEDLKNVHMPLESFMRVLDSAKNSRDESFWLHISAPGLRPSEVLNTQCNDFNVDTGSLYVYDPKSRRLGQSITEKEHLRFKGRTHAETLLIAPLRHRFFDATARYLREWFVPYPLGTKDQFLFQYIEPRRRGQPYYTVTNDTLNKSFQAACAAAHIPPPLGNPELKWTLYSLRHLYGDYITNDMRLPLEQAQAAMGHADARSTGVYCRVSRKVIGEAFEADDRKRFPTDPSEGRNYD
ncbi:tyrosine-type recombinase/integrase [Paraburkholderia sp. A3BS-1L]|uniref:tyrosine-type recombinase/integrase n=1 Tax=Paraburkholderia sp. A3BS-1L TaxID=3028375 RepID=UPI003DA80A06